LAPSVARMPNDHTIAVTGATGRIGSRVAQLLVQAGARPVLLVRDPDRLAPGLAESAEVRVVDLADPVSVRSATKGVSAAFWLDGVGESAPDPVAASAAFGEAAAAAVRANEVRRNVFVSSIGAELRGGAGAIDGLAAIEQALDATGADVTHLRCGFFYTNLLMDLDGLRVGRLTGTRSPGERIAWVDPRDIGDVAAARLLSAAWSGRHVQGVHGPQDLSWADVAAILTGVLGRQITYTQIGDDAVRQALRGAGLPAAAVEAIVGMTAGTRGITPEQPRDHVTTTPTTLAAWAYANLRPLVTAG
jgi:Predicted nucleoside-diphosphate-sugar epimerases